MKTKTFLDVPETQRLSRRLFNAGGIIFENKPACYIIENQETGKQYVGSTSKLSKRCNHHAQALKNGIHSNYKLQREYNNCRDRNNFVIDIAYHDTVEEALDREQLILDEGHGGDVLLNICDDARTSLSGYDRSAALVKMTETKNTIEYKNKVAQESSERWKDPELRNKMITSMGQNVTVNGVCYGSIREASRETGVCVKTIKDRLQNNECVLDNVRTEKKKSYL